jgi:hypothetical protein
MLESLDLRTLSIFRNSKWPENTPFRKLDLFNLNHWTELSAKLVPTSADRGCHVVSVTDFYGCILGSLDRGRGNSFCLYSYTTAVCRNSHAGAMLTPDICKYTGNCLPHTPYVSPATSGLAITQSFWEAESSVQDRKFQSQKVYEYAQVCMCKPER